MITIDWTDADSYRALARFHYRSGDPATIARRPEGGSAVICARERQGNTLHLVGVLVVSMPTLNARWRPLVWPDLYDPASRRQTALLLNRHVRCLSRVIVDPRWRGHGIASELVRWYLDRALTPRTEALTAMGRYCPLFERAGMTPRTVPPSHRDTRLLDALHAARFDPLDLLVRDRLQRALDRAPLLSAELTRWAKSSRATRARAGSMQPAEIAVAAASVINAPLTAYTHASQHAQAQTQSQSQNERRPALAIPRSHPHALAS